MQIQAVLKIVRTDSGIGSDPHLRWKIVMVIAHFQLQQISGNSIVSAVRCWLESMPGNVKDLNIDVYLTISIVESV